MSETRELSRDVKEYFVYASFVQGMNKNANHKLWDYKIFANIFRVKGTLCNLAISGTRGSSGFGSQRSEQMERRT